MTIKLLHYTPLWVIDKAIGKCWDSQKEYVDKKRMYRVGNKNKHSSTLEHVLFNFDIDGISRACLQELARHRHASLSVKSTRYTLKELKKVTDASELVNFYVRNEDEEIDDSIWNTLVDVHEMLKRGVSNDVAKYMLPEAYKTSLVWSINMRSLQNFLTLRTSSAALPEIRELAKEIFKQIPESHKFMLEEFVNNE
jgi:thymidylate synthase (FAD)